MRDRIGIDPNIHFGKPCVAGTRITAQGVLELVRAGIPFDKIIQDYHSDLHPEDIRACIQVRDLVNGVSQDDSWESSVV